MSLLVFVSWTSQGASQVVRIDGSLFDNTGIPVTGTRDIQIKAYDASTAGSLLWTSSVYTPSISTGKFSIDLDASSGAPSLTQRLLDTASGGQVWFQIEYDTGATNGAMNSAVAVSPRIRAKGTLFAVASAKAESLSGVSASVAELNTLVGASANVQTQLNAKLAAADISGKADSTSVIAKAGDTMTGDLGLAGSQATASRALILDASRRIASSAVTSVELGYLAGVTSNIGAKLNLVGAAELGYLAGVTSSLAAKLNPVTVAEVGFLSGATANIQTQLNAVSGSSAATYQTTAGSCDAAFTSVDTRTVYMCNHGYSGYYSGSSYLSESACPSTTPSTSAGSPPASGFWAIELGSITLRTCSSTTRKACYETTSGSCGSGYTSVDTKTLYACGHGYSGYYNDFASKPSYVACATTTPTTTAGSPPPSGFWSIQLSSATIRVCCQ